MYCLDSDVLVAYFRGDVVAKKKLESLQENDFIGTTVVNACELFEGIYGSEKNPERDYFALKSLLDKIRLYGFGLVEAEVAGRIASELSKNGAKIGDLDTLISGIALANNLTIVTRNVKHFGKVEGLKIETW